MEAGSRELARSASAYAAGIAFALAYLVTTFCGGGLTASLVRGCAAAVVTLFAARLLLQPLLRSVLDAMARDTAARPGAPK